MIGLLICSVRGMVDPSMLVLHAHPASSSKLLDIWVKKRDDSDGGVDFNGAEVFAMR